MHWISVYLLAGCAVYALLGVEVCARGLPPEEAKDPFKFAAKALLFSLIAWPVLLCVALGERFK